MEEYNKDRINENLMKNSKIEKLDRYLYKVSRLICKIKTSKNIGSGFLIKLYKGNNPFYCLMTNEHVIEKEIIELKEKIEIYYDNEFERREIELNKEERYIKDYKYIDIDIIIIEINKKDNINEEYFLLPNIEYRNGYYKEYVNKEIYIPQYPEGGELSNSKGKIKEINNYEFSHLASTKRGSSGSPIFIDGTIKVIGIHKQSRKDNSENYGNFIYPIIESLKKDLKYDKKYYKKDIYEGEYKNDFREGYGKYIWEDGEYYIGEWLNGNMHGKGIKYYKNGNIKYEGDFINSNFEGKGKYIWENDEYYIGEWLNGKRNGKGIIYYKNGNIKYEGDYINDKREGKGKYIYENGEYYIGEWLNNNKHGKGILYYKNSNIKYVGDFINDKFE